MAAALFAAPALAAGGDLQQCAALQDPAARLACYDQAQQQRSEPPADPASPAPTAAPEPATAPAAAAAPTAPSPEDRFGLPEAVAASITAHIDGKFIEWRPGTLIRLDNGQVWKCMEEKSAYYPRLPDNAEVEITRGMLGYRMEIKAIRRSIYVRRVS